MADIVFETLDAVPEELHEVAKKNEDGKFTLNLVPKTKLDEFRDNNVKVSKERDELQVNYTKLAGIVGDNPDEFTENLAKLRETSQLVEDGKLKKSGDIESELATRTENMKASHAAALQDKDAEVQAWKTKAENAEQKFQMTLVDQAIRSAALREESGVITTALDDIISRGRAVFSVSEDGKVVAKHGDNVIYGEDGTTPLDAAEWLNGLKKNAPHFFKESAGGAAEGGKGKSESLGGYSRDEFDKLPAKEQLAAYRRGSIK